MNIDGFSLLTFFGSLTAGFPGARTSPGGGVVIVPLLPLVLGVDIRYAIGASLISVIATSCGAADAYVKEGFSNIRLGMFPEMATTFGALFGAALAARISTHAIAVIFAVALLNSAFLSARSHGSDADTTEDTRHFLPRSLHLDAAYPGPQGPVSYHVHHIPTGFSLMFMAGTLSGPLGIGSGAVKVLAMDRAMRAPFKVSTTTSNFMIGVTAAASARVYLNRGYIDAGLAMPVMLGVVLGSLSGSMVLLSSGTRLLRIIFAAVILILGIEVDEVAQALDPEGFEIRKEQTGGVGTRHHSAYSLCNALHDVVAAVVSQDGTAQLVKWNDGMVTVWEQLSPSLIEACLSLCRWASIPGQIRSG